jgi:hypothetical protein
LLGVWIDEYRSHCNDRRLTRTPEPNDAYGCHADAAGQVQSTTNPLGYCERRGGANGDDGRRTRYQAERRERELANGSRGAVESKDTPTRKTEQEHSSALIRTDLFGR